MNSNSLASHLHMRISSLVGRVDREELMNELKQVSAIVGLGTNLTGLLFGVGLALFGTADELRAAGVVFTLAFALGSLSLFGLVRSYKAKL